MNIAFSGGPSVSTWGQDDKGRQVWRARLADNVGFFTTSSADMRTNALKKLALKAIADSV